MGVYTITIFTACMVNPKKKENIICQTLFAIIIHLTCAHSFTLHYINGHSEFITYWQIKETEFL